MIFKSEFLADLWPVIVDRLELPSIRMLVQQRTKLHDVVVTTNKSGEKHVVFRLEVSQHWLAMVQSRVRLIEASASAVLGSSEIVLIGEE